VRLRSQINEKDAEVKGLTSSIASTQQENDRLQSSIDALDTPEGLEQVARDQLGMVSEGEIVFEDVGDS
jgi:cell division protein FtsB